MVIYNKGVIFLDVYFNFTDECGIYNKNRSDKFNKNNPFFVRSNLIISVDDYISLQQKMTEIKAELGIEERVEIKWSHYGNVLKNNCDKKVKHNLNAEELIDYYRSMLNFLCELKSVCIYYTITKNDSIGKIDEIKLIKMHLQNAYQRVQQTMEERDGYAIVVADDLNDKSKVLKQAIYELMLSGDYVKYTKIKKGLYIDYSDECSGLQMADILAGIFTATLKYVNTENQKSKFKVGYDLFFKYVYKKVRVSNWYIPNYKVYGYGIKAIPADRGKDVVTKITDKIESQLYYDSMEIVRELL